MYGRCTILFEDPFWVAIFERGDESGFAVARFVFGAEPGDAELYQFALHKFQTLRFGSPVAPPESEDARVGFKRRQRLARRAVEHSVGTFAQRALQTEREALKETRQVESREEKEARERQRFLQKQEKKREKHRGR